MQSSKNKKGLLVVLGVSAMVFAAWYMYSHTKRYYAKTIVKLGGNRNFAALMTFQEGYLKAWAKALIKAKTQFSFEGKDYNTAGGLVATK
jgi:hypothetical protein